jgi:replicative DNA helicase
MSYARIEQEIVQSDAQIAIIDYARYIDGWDDGPQAAKRIVFDLGKLARTTGKHIMLLTQLKAEAQGRRPGTEHFQDTTALAQASEVVILLHRPFFEMGVKDQIIHARVAKNRWGIEGSVHLKWIGKTLSFYDIDPDQIPFLDCCRRKDNNHARTQ